MATFVVLLRGVNVGGRSLSMERLRALCGELGYADVRTYIQSGNVVLSAAGAAAALETRLEAGILETFDLEVPVVARTAARWAAYLDCPFPEAPPNRVLLALSKRKPARGAAEALRARAAPGDRIVVRGDAVWFHFPDGFGKSKVTPALIDRAVGSPATTRNLNTVRKLAELAADR